MFYHVLNVNDVPCGSSLNPHILWGELIYKQNPVLILINA